MIRFTKMEIALMKKQDIARVATISEKGWPQVTPVVHLFDRGCVYFIVDFDSKKYKNLKRNNKTGLTIDQYSRQPSSVIIQGYAEIIEHGKEFRKVEKLFELRHAYYKANPVKDGDAAIIKIVPVRKFSSF